MHDIKNFDLSVIYTREDGSFVVNQGMYHVPNEGEWTELYTQVEQYAVEHPEVVMPEPEPTFETEQEPQTQEEVIDMYKRYVQRALDAFAQTRGYDDIHTAASYKDSSDAQFKLEGEYCYELRTVTWRACWTILDQVLDGEIEQPTKEELIAMLPVGSAKWPDEE